MTERGSQMGYKVLNRCWKKWDMG